MQFSADPELNRRLAAVLHELRRASLALLGRSACEWESSSSREFEARVRALGAEIDALEARLQLEVE